jgi:hypothetical protein
MKTKTTCLILALELTLGTAAFVQAASTVQFSVASYTVAENAGAVTLAVQLTGDTNTPSSVDYVTTDGTATNGLKYTAVGGTLAFGDVELWTINGGGHFPTSSSEFSPRIIDWLLAHPKP